MSEYTSNNDRLETLAVRRKRLHQRKLVIYYDKKNNIKKYHFER